MIRADFAVLPSAFDPFVAVLVKIGKIFPNFFVSSGNNISILNRSKLVGQAADCGNMKFVLMRLSKC